MNPEVGITPAAVCIRQLRLTNVSMQDALNAMDAALVAQVPTKIAFVNADCVNIAARNADYRQDLAAMDWVFVDGIGMKIAGKLLNQPIRANVNGTDLFPLLCADLARSRRSLFLLGAKPGVAQAAAQWATQRFPELLIAGTQDGYFTEAQTASVLAQIRSTQPDVILVAMGAPRQEAWINRHMNDTGATLALGVGGLFDYFSGNIPRAPMWMQRGGLEWIFRLLQEPTRLWRRYLLGNWLFLARILKDKIMMTFSKSKQ